MYKLYDFGQFCTWINVAANSSYLQNKKHENTFGLNSDTGKLFNICFNFWRAVRNVKTWAMIGVIQAIGDGCHVRQKIIPKALFIHKVLRYST